MADKKTAGADVNLRTPEATPDMADVCDEVWHGTNGEDLLVASGCPGCHYVAGAAAVLGLIRMAGVIAARERAKPLAPDPYALPPCLDVQPRDMRKCNLEQGHAGTHKRISPKGRIVAAWS